MISSAKIRSFYSKPLHRRWIFTVVKALILVFLAWAIYHQVFIREDLGRLISGFREHLQWNKAGWLLLAVSLMPVNWGLEVVKWRRLLQPELILTYRQALKSILAGISVSLFTPNRIGEFGGRLLGIPASKSWLGLAATFVGNMAQWVPLFLGGLWGLAQVGLSLWPDLEPFYSQYYWVVWGAALILPILYIHLGRFWEWLKEREPLRKSKWGQRMKLQTALPGYKKKTLLWVLGVACTRYLIYSSQYLFLLYGFGFELEPLQALAGIATVFLIQSSVPLPPFMALIARGELSILLWSEYGANELVVLISTFALFIINLLVPALLGGATIVRIK